MCSDGIYGMVEEVVIEEIVKNNSLKTAPKILVERANQSGGKDNSTVILVDIESFPQEFPGRFSLGRIKKIFSHWGETGIK
jgi:serine/threonine protein phosphatase PrpC